LLMRMGGEALRRGVVEVVEAFRGERHVFNLGHGITPDVDPESVRLLVETVRGVAG